MKQQFLTARDLGNISGILSDVLDHFQFDRDAIVLNGVGTTDTATRRRLLADFFARYSIANAKACVAWAPLEQTYHPATVTEILDAIPRIQDPEGAQEQINNLLHWTHGPDETPYAPAPMRLTLITLISAYVQTAKPLPQDKTTHQFRRVSAASRIHDQIRNLTVHYGECAWIDALWRSQNVESKDDRKFWRLVLDLLGGQQRAGEELTPEFVAAEFWLHFRPRTHDVVARRVQRADIEQDQAAFAFWMAVLTLVHEKEQNGAA